MFSSAIIFCIWVSTRRLALSSPDAIFSYDTALGKRDLEQNRWSQILFFWISRFLPIVLLLVGCRLQYSFEGRQSRLCFITSRQQIRIRIRINRTEWIMFRFMIWPYIANKIIKLKQESNAISQKPQELKKYSLLLLFEHPNKIMQEHSTKFLYGIY